VIGRRGGKLGELEELYRGRFDVFGRVAASVTGDPERARDAVQEAFATAVRKRGTFRAAASVCRTRPPQFANRLTFAG
jgi:DNA-directed RNA polymerase specialized sigma24 family protein